MLRRIAGQEERYMAKDWLNVFVDTAAVSTSTQWVKAAEIVPVNNRTVRLHESDRSGAVTISQQGLTTYGDAEVYLKLTFSNGTFKYLSAPLHTSLDVDNVQSLELNILFLTGPTGASFRALVNAHCVYEIL
jgi:hypothetical protein